VDGKQQKKPVQRILQSTENAVALHQPGYCQKPDFLEKNFESF
jgi:hypothetical protein